MAIRHRFVSTMVDGPDDTLLRPSDWNAEHDGITVGTGTLVDGVCVVLTGDVTADSIVVITPQVSGDNPGSLSVTARSAGVSFTVSSTNALDDRSFGYVMVEP